LMSARGQNALTPLGVPRPDGPSQPVRAVHHWSVGQVPFGGAAILIIVGVALETMKQIEAQMQMRHYEGFLSK